MSNITGHIFVTSTKLWAGDRIFDRGAAEVQYSLTTFSGATTGIYKGTIIVIKDSIYIKLEPAKYVLMVAHLFILKMKRGDPR